MNAEEIRMYCLKKSGSTESFPFDETTLVFKVGGKMFALLGLDDNLTLNLKCDPEKAIELRERYPTVLPGYHMNKKYWNTILIDGSLEDRLILEWIDDSYRLIVANLPVKQRIGL
jgi:predicted DNA-binding protein (MmcQ/YjbR family)